MESSSGRIRNANSKDKSSNKQMLYELNFNSNKFQLVGSVDKLQKLQVGQ
jgi:hypothetical protein